MLKELPTAVCAIYSLIRRNHSRNSSFHRLHSAVPFVSEAPNPCPPVPYCMNLWGTPFAVSAESRSSALCLSTIGSS